MILKELSQNLGVSEDIFVKLVRTWLDVFDEDMKMLHGLQGSVDFTTMRGLAHKIKGSSIQMGFAEIAEVSLALEKKAVASNGEGMEEMLEKLAELRKEVAALLE